MKKLYEIFQGDVKKEFNANTSVDCMIRTFDIEKYVITPNIEDIFGNFLAYFFCDNKFLKEKCNLLQAKYHDKLGPGVWICGASDTGKSQMLKVIYTLFTLNSIDYTDDKGNVLSLNVISTLQSKISYKTLGELIGSIRPIDYITFIFSAAYFAKSGGTIFDYLSKGIAKEHGMSYSRDRKYSLTDAAEFLNKTLRHLGKRRMIIFIDDILAILDSDDKISEFSELLDLLDKDIWFIVTTDDNQISVDKGLVDRFGKKQRLLPQVREYVLRQRFLAKRDEARIEIEKTINIDGLQQLFSCEKQDIIDCYPFYPYQVAYVNKLAKCISSGLNIIKVIKTIIANPIVCDKELGYFVDTELIYEELHNIASIREFDSLMNDIQAALTADTTNKLIDKRALKKVAKAIVLLAHVEPKGISAKHVLPFIFSDEAKSNDGQLQSILDFMVDEGFIIKSGSLYKPLINGAPFTINNEPDDFDIVEETKITEEPPNLTVEELVTEVQEMPEDGQEPFAQIATEMPNLTVEELGTETQEIPEALVADTYIAEEVSVKSAVTESDDTTKEAEDRQEPFEQINEETLNLTAEEPITEIQEMQKDAAVLAGIDAWAASQEVSGKIPFIEPDSENQKVDDLPEAVSSEKLILGNARRSAISIQEEPPAITSEGLQIVSARLGHEIKLSADDTNTLALQNPAEIKPAPKGILLTGTNQYDFLELMAEEDKGETAATNESLIIQQSRRLPLQKSDDTIYASMREKSEGITSGKERIEPSLSGLQANSSHVNYSMFYDAADEKTNLNRELQNTSDSSGRKAVLSKEKTESLPQFAETTLLSTDKPVEEGQLRANPAMEGFIKQMTKLAEADTQPTAFKLSELSGAADNVTKAANTAQGLKSDEEAETPESHELMSRLLKIYDKIREDAMQDLDEGKKVTAEMFDIHNSSRSCYTIKLRIVGSFEASEKAAASLELLGRLDKVFDEIRENAMQWLKTGKRVTVEMFETNNGARSSYTINLKNKAGESQKVISEYVKEHVQGNLKAGISAVNALPVEPVRDYTTASTDRKFTQPIVDTKQAIAAQSKFSSAADSVQASNTEDPRLAVKPARPEYLSKLDITFNKIREDAIEGLHLGKKITVEILEINNSVRSSYTVSLKKAQGSLASIENEKHEVLDKLDGIYNKITDDAMQGYYSGKKISFEVFEINNSMRSRYTINLSKVFS